MRNTGDFIYKKISKVIVSVILIMTSVLFAYENSINDLLTVKIMMDVSRININKINQSTHSFNS